jgi:hypothetical protein
MLKKFLPLYVAQSPIATHKLRDLKPAPAADKAINCKLFLVIPANVQA